MCVNIFTVVVFILIILKYTGVIKDCWRDILFPIFLTTLLVIITELIILFLQNEMMEFNCENI